MTLGRGTDDNEVDADLSQEGPAHKISRRHFLIRLNSIVRCLSLPYSLL